MKILALLVFCLSFGLAPMPVAPPSDACKRLSPYAQRTGFDISKSGFSTSERRLKGLVLVEFAADQNPAHNKNHQHPSWTKAGAMGPIAIDEDGAVFVAPVPMINVLDNPPALQNKLYRVSPLSGEMSVFVNLPAFEVPNGKPATEKNPFGLLGLVYDCESKILYASSVAHSTAEQEVGRVFAIEKNSANVLDKLEGLDIMGICPSDVTGQKRLYLGKCRTSDVFSVGLLPDGRLNKNDLRKELSIEGLGERGDDRVRKIRFNERGDMVLKGIEFFYNLIAPTEKQETTYNFRYDATARQWRFVSYGG